MKFLTWILILLTACGPVHRASPVTSAVDTLAPLRAKADLYLNLVTSHQDASGFILSDECDSLLFSSLLSAAAPHLHIDINAAKDTSGQWFRRPGHDCGPSFGNSASTISRDMLLGVLWHMWRNRDLADANQLMLDLQKHNYILRGEGGVGELAVNTNLLSILGDLIYKLGGPNYIAERNLPVIFSAGPGFQGELGALQIALSGDINGHINNQAFGVLAALVQTNPQNPLYQAVYHRYLDGNYEIVIQLLSNTAQWPDNQLPTTLNHCDAWPIQRDDSDAGWRPCIPEHELTGAELPVIFYLLISPPGA